MGNGELRHLKIYKYMFGMKVQLIHTVLIHKHIVEMQVMVG